MNEYKYKVWDLALKMITSILTIVIISVGVFQYKKNSEREFRKSLFDEQYKIYIETIDIASRIANTPIDSVRSKKYKGLKEEFFVLFYGKLYFIQDTLVEVAMINFANNLMRYERADPSVRIADMQSQSLLLGNACRKAVQKTWQIELPELKRQKDDESY